MGTSDDEARGRVMGIGAPRIRETIRLLYDSAESWTDGRALRLSAGVAYYALIALVPVFFLSLTIATFFLGQTVREDVARTLIDILGPEFGQALLGAIDAVDVGGSTVITSLIGTGVVIFTATLLFVAWKEVVDLRWDIPRERGVRATLARRLFGLAAVVGAGALLTLNLAVGTFLGFLDQFIRSPIFEFLLSTTESLAVLALGGLFIGILFKYTPDVEVSWRDVWFAAVITMAMLTLGGWGYGVYLDHFGFSSAAGVAGSAFLGLALVYYATGILLYGMEIVRHVTEEERYVPLAFRRIQHRETDQSTEA